MQARELIEQVYICLCRQNALYGEWARASGISYHTIMTLYAIDQMGPCTQRRIAAEWSLSKQTVNTVVKDLESRGYVRFTAGPGPEGETGGVHPGGPGVRGRLPAGSLSGGGAGHGAGGSCPVPGHGRRYAGLYGGLYPGGAPWSPVVTPWPGNSAPPPCCGLPCPTW